jgi:hypothetical protein
VQEQHDVAHRPLLAPGGREAFGEPAPDARHLAQALRLALDHLEHPVAERRHQLFGHGTADALDHARAEVRLDALERARRHGDQRMRPELQAIAGAGAPFPIRAHHLARRDLGAFADHRHRLALLGELDAQHAKAALGVVERHALDQAGQGLRLRLGRGERERSGFGRRAVLSAGLHGAPNLTPRAAFDKRQVDRDGRGSATGRRCRRTISATASITQPIRKGTR